MTPYPSWKQADILYDMRRDIKSQAEHASRIADKLADLAYDVKHHQRRIDRHDSSHMYVGSEDTRAARMTSKATWEMLKKLRDLVDEQCDNFEDMFRRPRPQPVVRRPGGNALAHEPNKEEQEQQQEDSEDNEGTKQVSNKKNKTRRKKRSRKAKNIQAVNFASTEADVVTEQQEHSCIDPESPKFAPWTPDFDYGTFIREPTREGICATAEKDHNRDIQDAPGTRNLRDFNGFPILPSKDFRRPGAIERQMRRGGT